MKFYSNNLYRAEVGFSLIELLVTIAIVGVLASIAIPEFQKYREKAYKAAAQSDLKNMVTAAEAYFNDNDTYPVCTNRTACLAVLPGMIGFSEGVGARITRPSSKRISLSVCTEKVDSPLRAGASVYFNIPMGIGIPSMQGKMFETQGSIADCQSMLL